MAHGIVVSVIAAILVAVTPAAGAATVCKRVDANGRVHFEDCNAPVRGKGNAEEIDVEATRTGGTMASPEAAGAVRAKAAAGRGNGSSAGMPPGAPPGAVSGTGGAAAPRPDSFRNRSEEQAYLADLEERCAADLEGATQAVRKQRIEQCVASGEMPEAKCRAFYRDYGSPTVQPGGTRRTVPLPASCLQANEARQNRRFQ